MANIFGKVTEKDKGWNNIKKELKMFKKAYTKIGIQSDAGESEDGTDLVIIAATNEWGSDSAGKNKNIVIPERSVFRAGYDEKKKEIDQFIFELIGKIEDQELKAKRAMGLLGEFGEGIFKRKMVQLKTPANAQSTIDKKGSSNPLIDEGRVLAAIRHEDVI